MDTHDAYYFYLLLLLLLFYFILHGYVMVLLSQVTASCSLVASFLGRCVCVCVLCAHIFTKNERFGFYQLANVDPDV